MQQVRAYRTTDGTLFDSEAAATKHELEVALANSLMTGTSELSAEGAFTYSIASLISDAEKLSRLFLHYCNTNQLKTAAEHIPLEANKAIMRATKGKAKSNES